jgi:hypothetical protein
VMITEVVAVAVLGLHYLDGLDLCILHAAVC